MYVSPHFGICFRIPLLKSVPLFFQIDYRPTNLQLANINVIIEESRGARTQIDLKDVDDDLESLYHAKARAWFPFSLHLKVPNVIDTQLVQVISSHFVYTEDAEFFVVSLIFFFGGGGGGA